MDRNIQTLILRMAHLMSLSARRAWIEIDDISGATGRILVALRKESVDRNIFLLPLVLISLSRSPQGERG